MPENTFDIVSKIDLQEVSNAIQQALKEVHTRFDLEDSKSNIELEGKDAIILREDGSVFIHLHPMGTTSTAARDASLRDPAAAPSPPERRAAAGSR